MRSFSLIVAMLALAFVGCSSEPRTARSTPAVRSSGDLSIFLAFDPTPPKAGTETITVSLQDQGHFSVKGAKVTISTKMPYMHMSGPSLTLHDNGDGTYSVVTKLNYQTKWVFDVKVFASGTFSTAEFETNLK